MCCCITIDYQSAFTGAEELPEWIGISFPDLLPSVPCLEHRKPDFDISNPFEEEQDGIVIHPTFKHTVWNTFFKPQPAVNAFIKVRWFEKRDKHIGQPAPRLYQQGSSTSAGEVDPIINPEAIFADPVSRLPPDFGDVNKLDTLDRKLFQFCEATAYAHRN